MNDTVYINTSDARNNFANIINAVYLENKNYVVKRSGIPIVKISKIVDTSKKSGFSNLVGLISDFEAKKMTRLYKKGRDDGSKLKNKLV